MNKSKKMIAFAIFACSFMSAVEITIVTTAIPSIVKDLHGFNLASHIFSIYLLTSAVATAVFGKLSDLYGRKKLLQISILIFLIGSILCGMSKTMFMLIVARGVQGIGSGAINTLSMAIIGDIFAVEERAKIQGYNSTVWSLASLIAPVIGGAILLKLTWNWIFYINIPIGLLSMYLIKENYHASETRSDSKLDVKGLVILTLFIIALIQAMTALEKHSLSDPQVLIPVLIGLILALVFKKVEKNVEHPVLPIQLFSKDIFLIMVMSFLTSMVLIAMDVYNPQFMQNVSGYPPMYSTVAIVPMSGAWVLASFLLSKIIHKYTTKIIMVVSLALLALGQVALIIMRPDTELLHIGLAVFLVGLGFGGCFNMLLFIVQEALDKDDMGMASGSVMLVRTLGQTLGISAFGLSLNVAVNNYFMKKGMSVDTSSLLTNTSIDKIDLVNSLFKGYNIIYILCLVATIACILCSLMLTSNRLANSNKQ
ncbi:MAG: MDR family MFS transporter [Peptostreptococcus sp.]|uniref:MDR family MFS transporter n=1 Tax=Peptostreptococcus TaxID=1257 RepID=UPI0007672CE9|nr:MULTISPECIES: MDR family MFS transporter [Peptostreptococcus]KXB70078.1 transporter, major facilitator family protein [Peptostreptococcus anaerobius]MDU1264703.1 MDR family MFS transporter [Peptostreptococcus sp.]